MNSMELDAARAEIIRRLFEVDDLEALKKVKRSVARIMKSVKVEAEEVPTPYTMDELNARIDESEAEIEAGAILTNAEANAEVRRVLPWLR